MTLLVHITHAGLIRRLGFHFKHWLYGKCLAGRTHTEYKFLTFSLQSSQLTVYTDFEVRSTRPLIGNIIQPVFAGISLPESFTLETQSEEHTVWSRRCSRHKAASQEALPLSHTHTHTNRNMYNIFPYILWRIQSNIVRGEWNTIINQVIYSRACLPEQV